AALEQETGARRDRRERVAQVVAQDADEHLAELRHVQQLLLTALGPRARGLRLLGQLLFANCRDHELLVRVALRRLHLIRVLLERGGAVAIGDVPRDLDEATRAAVRRRDAAQGDLGFEGAGILADPRSLAAVHAL